MPARIRKTPIRTCVVCREAQSKRDLVRIIRAPEGEVRIDLTGKKPGRGAYVCSREECRTGPQTHRQLSRALGTTISQEMVASWFAGSGE
jgi:predicted RNA-binding protein YlxR (DUF448 family)